VGGLFRPPLSSKSRRHDGRWRPSLCDGGTDADVIADASKADAFAGLEAGALAHADTIGRPTRA
jgi:hypothetical protein